MKTLLKAAMAFGLAMSIGLVSAPDALAKAHDQGSTSEPGANVGAETAGPAQGLGGALGNGKGPGDTDAGASPGASGEAGRGGDGASGAGNGGGAER